MAEPSILIIGTGAFGTSLAYHLSQTYSNASNVTIVGRGFCKQFMAAAMDLNRIVRTNYVDPLYAGLAKEALREWQEHPYLQNHFHQTGWLYLNKTGDDHVDKLVCQSTGTSRQLRSIEEARREFPMLRSAELDGFDKTYYNPEAGWCDAAAATTSLLSAAAALGVRHIWAEVVEVVLDESWSKIKGVTTSSGELLTADKIVLATGAWTNELLSPLEHKLNMMPGFRIEHQIKPQGAVSAYLTMTREQATEIAETPVIVYGSSGVVIPPSKDNQNLKLSNSFSASGHISHSDLDAPRIPEEKWEMAISESLKRNLHSSLMSKLLSDWASDVSKTSCRMCWDAVTPTDDWLIDKHPDKRLSNLYLVTGGSFHAYKFLPVLGKLISNVVNGVSNGEQMDRAWGWKSASAQTSVQRPKAKL